MKKKRFEYIISLCFFIAVISYVAYLRFKPIDNYAKVFDHMGNNCNQNSCSHLKRLELARKAVYHDPSFSDGFTRLAYLLEKKGDLKLALRYHEKAVILDHKNDSSLVRLGIYHFNDNELDKALRYLKHAYSFSGWGSSLNYYLGRIYERKGDFRKAGAHYLYSYHHNINNLLALARLGAMESLDGNKKQALEYVERIRDGGEEELASSLEDYMQLTSYEEFRPND